MFLCFTAYVSLKKNTRITADLGDPALLKLLKAEAMEKNVSVRQVLITALESYFAHRVESQSLLKISEQIFEEWNDKKDSGYDSL